MVSRWWKKFGGCGFWAAKTGEANRVRRQPFVMAKISVQIVQSFFSDGTENMNRQDCETRTNEIMRIKVSKGACVDNTQRWRSSTMGPADFPRGRICSSACAPVFHRWAIPYCFSDLSCTTQGPHRFGVGLEHLVPWLERGRSGPTSKIFMGTRISAAGLQAA